MWTPVRIAMHWHSHWVTLEDLGEFESLNMMPGLKTWLPQDAPNIFGTKKIIMVSWVLITMEAGVTWLIKNKSFASEEKRIKLEFAILWITGTTLPFQDWLVLYTSSPLCSFKSILFLYFLEAAVAPNCGGYNTAGTLTYADALLIPMASTASGASLVNGNFCGQGNSFVGNVASGEAESYSQVCCKWFRKVATNLTINSFLSFAFSFKCTLQIDVCLGYVWRFGRTRMDWRYSQQRRI